MRRSSARQLVAAWPAYARRSRSAASLSLGAVALVGCGRVAFDPLGDRDAGVDAVACTDVLCLDPTFAGDGIATLDVGGVDNVEFAYRALAVLPDDRLVIGGAGGVPGALNLVALRLTAAGAIDPTFGTAGIASIDAGGTDERAIGVALDSQGRILLAGATGPTVVAGVLARLSPDGQLDPTLDGDGVIVNDANASGPVAFNGVTVDDSGRLVIAGQANGGDFDWIILRMLDDGTLDGTLGGSGLSSVDLGNRDQFGTLAAATSAGILVVGQTFNGASFDGALYRATETGAPDSTFGTGGVAQPDLGDSERYFVAALDASGRIVAGGQARGIDDDMLIMRFTSAGIADAGFGAAAIVRIDRGAGENVRGIVVLPDGRIAFAGHREVAGERVAVIGLVEPGGAVIDVRDVDLAPGDDEIQDLEIDHHGRLVALGSVDDAADPASTDFAIARFIVP